MPRLEKRAFCSSPRMRTAPSSQRANSVGVCRVFGGFERHLNVTLGSKVVDRIGLRLLHHLDHVRHVAKLQEEPQVRYVRVFVDIFDPTGVEGR